MTPYFRVGDPGLFFCGENSPYSAEGLWRLGFLGLKEASSAVRGVLVVGWGRVFRVGLVVGPGRFEGGCENWGIMRGIDFSSHRSTLQGLGLC